MTVSCCCPPEAGNDVREQPAQNFRPDADVRRMEHQNLSDIKSDERPYLRSPRATNACPVCSAKGKPVQGQTIKAHLSVSLRAVQDTEYLFCKTQTCPVVYFSPDGEQTLTLEQVRERVYQKEPDGEDVFACYCFRHTVGEIRAASPELRIAIVDDIHKGINTGQCACDLRNPQGSCCLGNVRELIKLVDAPAAEKAK